jgi:DNA-binding response OmpR family regulator
MWLVTRSAPERQQLIPSVQTHPLERLTAQERAVFDVLVANRGRVLSRQELARRAGLAELSPRRCDSLIVGIRRRVGADRVRTVRRRGWMLVA